MHARVAAFAAQYRRGERRRLCVTSAAGRDHLVGYANDPVDAFGKRNERGSLLGRAYEPPKVDDAAAHNDVARTKIGPVLIAQARQQLRSDPSICIRPSI
jgi:hypothetical protein